MHPDLLLHQENYSWEIENTELFRPYAEKYILYTTHQPIS